MALYTNLPVYKLGYDLLTVPLPQVNIVVNNNSGTST